MGHEYLFNEYDIFGVIQGHTEAVKKRIQSSPSNKTLNASEHDLVQALIEEFYLHVPVIKDEDIYISYSGETQVDVSHDPMRGIFDRSKPFYIPGNKTIIAVPFEGDNTFFKIQPQTFTTSPPRAEVQKNEILLTYVTTDHNPEAIKAEYQRTVSSIKQYLAWHSESAAQFNNGLEALILSQLWARKDRLLKDAGMTAAIGLPMKKREGVSTTYAVPVTRRVPKIEQIRATEAFKPAPCLYL